MQKIAPVERHHSIELAGVIETLPGNPQLAASQHILSDIVRDMGDPFSKVMQSKENTAIHQPCADGEKAGRCLAGKHPRINARGRGGDNGDLRHVRV